MTSKDELFQFVMLALLKQMPGETITFTEDQMSRWAKDNPSLNFNLEPPEGRVTVSIKYPGDGDDDYEDDYVRALDEDED